MGKTIRDESTASAYWASVNTFCALSDVHVIADAPVGCYNLVGAAVMDYTDAIPYLENFTPTSLTEKEIASSGSSEIVRDTITKLQEPGRQLILVSSAESEMIGSDHERMLAMQFPLVRFFPSHSLGENEWQGRDRALEWLFKNFDDGRPAAVEPGTVSIIGPTYGCFNSPSDLAEIKRLIAGAGGRLKHVFPFESRLSDISDLKNSEVIILMYHEFGSRLGKLLNRPVLYGPFGIDETSTFIMELARLLGCEQTGEAFIAKEKQTVLAPIWDLWRGPQAEWFPTVRFGVVAAASYANGLKKFLADEMGMQCLFSHITEETDNTALREQLASVQPQFFFGRIVDKIYLAELDAKTRFIPAGFPGPIVRRALGTPFMGHSGAVFLLQEIVNSLYDMLFNFLPLNRLSEAGETPTQKPEWDAEAEEFLNEAVKKAPFISQISFGRELKKKAELLAIRQGKKTISKETVSLVL
ncbi:chlorophyllide a reductase subunit Z [Chlorobium phaeovibrioides]|uniref:Chlorophyllide a reductase subunit Z n=1 Tax=Chlorobium phaeovibrioides TaxID=1094 RepID=A0A3S0L113_CHLPH|nr:chlorophyllide a reductase subunit Z [Chlorobium phaeovibrioides]MWV53459.1 chlorophyllide a reductase subunit Z [Chlorobium phaeovibrioides]QEQ57595.1 chlorophyllide a reductase subunit Z [Chlorobium phaeovibrioides]RTY34461.1 chlorophyllide a reductase subunit Z [Chlorobium phaeovibrioides]RTY36284.1 chlorophyllide a reductase subunit Z [Chlorobium phaeovibrioides]